MFDLDLLAKQVMEGKGLLATFPEAALQEAASFKSPTVPKTPFKDLRQLGWVSIDNDTSLDLDQITWAEGNRLFIAIADVAALVGKNSPLDLYAQHNTTSVYTPTLTFPMLPDPLSHNLTSLVENEDRAAIVTEVEVDLEGRLIASEVYPAWVRNHAKLTYNKVGQDLVNHTASEQLQLQDQLAQRIKAFRMKQGALNFLTHELQAQVQDKRVISIEEASHNRASELIENFMIASNLATIHFMNAHNLPSLRRTVQVPKRWDRIVELAKEHHYTLPVNPDSKALQVFLNERQKSDPANFAELSLAIIKLIGRGEYSASFPNKGDTLHFDLAVINYAHTTAPNRRYPDLINQRLLKSYLYQEPLPYSEEELIQMADHCTQKEDDATKVERHMIKSAAALYLSHQIGRKFKAMVSGVNENGVWVRLQQPPIEGKLLHPKPGLDVGDKIEVQLVSTDVAHGYIDFK